PDDADGGRRGPGQLPGGPVLGPAGPRRLVHRRNFGCLGCRDRLADDRRKSRERRASPAQNQCRDVGVGAGAGWRAGNPGATQGRQPGGEGGPSHPTAPLVNGASKRGRSCTPSRCSTARRKVSTTSSVAFATAGRNCPTSSAAGSGTTNTF